MQFIRKTFTNACKTTPLGSSLTFQTLGCLTSLLPRTSLLPTLPFNSQKKKNEEAKPPLRETKGFTITRKNLYLNLLPFLSFFFSFLLPFPSVYLEALTLEDFFHFRFISNSLKIKSFRRENLLLPN